MVPKPLTLEQGEESMPTACECCGRYSRTVHGFVYRNDDAYAVYYAGWSEGHPERGVTMAIAMGEWGDDSDASDRVSVGVRAFASSSEIHFSILDPEESPWSRTDLLGDMIPRKVALHHPSLKEVFTIAEVLVEHDFRVRDFFDRF